MTFTERYVLMTTDQAPPDVIAAWLSGPCSRHMCESAADNHSFACAGVRLV